MTFERPEVLALAPLLVLVVSLGVLGQWRRSLRLVDAYGGVEAARRLTARSLHVFPFVRLACLVLASVALAVAAAGPEAPQASPHTQRPVDVVVALDASLSMGARDLPTGTRAQRATEVLDRLTDALPGEWIGVEVFADWPYTLVPLTYDPSVIRFFSASVGPEVIGDRDQGTSFGAVLSHARATLEQRRRPDADAVLLLVSDGESFTDPATVLDSVASATAGGVRLWTAGVGSERGIELVGAGPDGTAVLDEVGRPVIARMDADLLRRMADAGGGSYHDVTDENGLDALLSEIAGTSRSAADADPPVDYALWLALLALPLLVGEGLADSRRFVHASVRAPERGPVRGTAREPMRGPGSGTGTGGRPA